MFYQLKRSIYFYGYILMMREILTHLYTIGNARLYNVSLIDVTFITTCSD